SAPPPLSAYRPREAVDLFGFDALAPAWAAGHAVGVREGDANRRRLIHLMTTQASLFPPALPDKAPEPHYVEASLDAVAGASRVAIDCETTGPQPMTATLTHVAFATTTRRSGFAHATEDTLALLPVLLDGRAL